MSGWRDLAACAEVDPDLFFPPNGGRSPGTIALARTICAGCQVRAQCLAEGLEHDRTGFRPDEHGMWGGLTAKERRRETG